MGKENDIYFENLELLDYVHNIIIQPATSKWKKKRKTVSTEVKQ